jgi:phage terminase small subunit
MAKPSNGHLTAKQRAFVNEFIKDSNATRAAIAVGYKEKTASQMAYKLVRHPLIKVEICRLQAEHLASAGITTEYTLYTIRDIIEDNKKPGLGPARHQVALRGAELLGKHQGLWDTASSERQRKLHELTTKELIALGMELQKKQEQPKQLVAEITDIS